MDSNKIDPNAELVQNQPIVSISKMESIPNKIYQQFRSAHITNSDTLKSSSKNRRVRVLFDYEASDDTELSVFANEVNIYVLFICYCFLFFIVDFTLFFCNKKKDFICSNGCRR
jgi:hypothetical protein